MKRTLTGWLLARMADFLVVVTLVAGSSIFEGRAKAVLDWERHLLFAGVSFLFVYIVGGFLITSLVWWFVSARRHWPPVVLAAGSAGLLLATLIGIHLYHAGWSHFDVFALLQPFTLISIALHGLSTWIVAAWVFRKRAASP